jgi:hypothetical protein
MTGTVDVLRSKGPASVDGEPRRLPAVESTNDAERRAHMCLKT